MPNDYFVPGFDAIGGVAPRRPRPMLSPSDYWKQKQTEMRSMPPMLSQPELVGGVDGPAVPPVMEVEAPAPPPMKAPSRVDRYREQVGEAPAPMRGLSRAALGFAQGGVPGLLTSLLDRKGADREAYDQKRKQFMDETALQGQDEAAEDRKLQRSLTERNIASVEDYRKQAAADRDEDRERQYATAGWTEVAPGELQEVPEEGKQARYEYANVGGKQRKRLTEYAKKSDAKAAEMETYRAVPPAIAKALGMKEGERVPPNELDGYIRMIESREAKAADREQRAELQAERIAAQRALTEIARSARTAGADFRNTMQMSNAYRAEQPVKSLYDVKQAYEGMANAGNDGAGDVTLMRLFAKITDPATGVREEEYRTMQNAGGVMNALKVYSSGGWVEGQRLSPETRASFLRIGKQILQNREKAVKPVQDKYRRMAGQFGVDPNMVIADDVSVQPEGGEVEQWERDANGRLVRKPAALKSPGGK